MSAGKVVAICLWGGFGSRQRSMTRRDESQSSKISNPAFRNLNAVPKPLMPVATVPMATIALERLNAAGIGEIYATTHVLHDLIQSHYVPGPDNPLGIRELWYEKIPMGTAPGLVMNLMLRASLREATVVAPSGDILSDLDIAAILAAHHEHESPCTIALNPVARREVHRFGTADLQASTGSNFGAIREFREKRPPHEALQSSIGGRSLFLNNSSFYVFAPEVFLRPLQDGRSLLQRMFPRMNRDFLETLESGKIDVKSQGEAEAYFAGFGPYDRNFNDFGGHVFPLLAGEGLLAGYAFGQYWNDVGDNETYWEANWHALMRRFSMRIPYPEHEPGMWIAPTAQLIGGCTIIPPVVIGENVTVEPGATVGPFAVLDAGWIIERGVEFVYSIAWPTFATEDYPEDLPLQIVRRGTRVEKSVVAGRLPVGDHLFKVVMGDGFATDKSSLRRTIVGLKLPMGSEREVAKQTRRILIIDDDLELTARLVDRLQESGWTCLEVVDSLEKAEKQLASTRYDVILLDSVLSPDEERKETEGVTILKSQKLNPDAPNFETPVLFWSGHESLHAFRGLSSGDALHIGERGVAVKKKEEIPPADLSEFILKELLKI